MGFPFDPGEASILAERRPREFLLPARFIVRIWVYPFTPAPHAAAAADAAADSVQFESWRAKVRPKLDRARLPRGNGQPAAAGTRKPAAPAMVRRPDNKFARFSAVVADSVEPYSAVL